MKPFHIIVIALLVLILAVAATPLALSIYNAHQDAKFFNPPAPTPTPGWSN